MLRTLHVGIPHVDLCVFPHVVTSILHVRTHRYYIGLPGFWESHTCCSGVLFCRSRVRVRVSTFSTRDQDNRSNTSKVPLVGTWLVWGLDLGSDRTILSTVHHTSHHIGHLGLDHLDHLGHSDHYILHTEHPMSDWVEIFWCVDKIIYFPHVGICDQHVGIYTHMYWLHMWITTCGIWPLHVIFVNPHVRTHMLTSTCGIYIPHVTIHMWISKSSHVEVHMWDLKHHM